MNFNKRIILVLLTLYFFSVSACGKHSSNDQKPDNGIDVPISSSNIFVGNWLSETGDLIVYSKYYPNTLWYTTVGIPALGAKAGDLVFFNSDFIMLADKPGLNLYVDNSLGTSYFIHKTPTIVLVDADTKPGILSKDVITVLIDSAPDSSEHMRIRFKRVVISNN